MPRVCMASTPSNATVPSLNIPGVGALVSMETGVSSFMMVNVWGLPNGIIVSLMPVTVLGSHDLHGRGRLIPGNE